MKIFCKFPTVNIPETYFFISSLICIAKNFIWTTLKAIFSIFRFFCTDQIPDGIFKFVSQPNIVLSEQTLFSKALLKLISSAFRWCINIHFKNCPLSGPGSHCWQFSFSTYAGIIVCSLTISSGQNQTLRSVHYRKSFIIYAGSANKPSVHCWVTGSQSTAHLTVVQGH